MINWIMSVLAIKGVLTKEEASYLAEELVLKTQPSRFSDAHQIVEKLFKDYKKNS